VSIEKLAKRQATAEFRNELVSVRTPLKSSTTPDPAERAV
jgi:hypothetical protein